MLSELQSIGRNLNQMTKVANQTGSIYGEDIKNIFMVISIYTNLMEKVFKSIKSIKESVEKTDFYTMTEQIEQVAKKLKKENIL